MPQVVIIEDDEWILKLLSGVVSAQGFTPVPTRTAREGLERICAVEPDCILCDVDLPDHDGYWVARKVRSHASHISVTPFIFLSARDDEASKDQGFASGGDVYMTKPFRVDEIGAQIVALVALCQRLRDRRDSLVNESTSEDTAMSGDLRQLSASTLLSILGMERRSGTVRLQGSGDTADIFLASGCVDRAVINGRELPVRDALCRVVPWSKGTFVFEPAESTIAPAHPQDTVAALLLDATRIVDEISADDPRPNPPSDRPSFDMVPTSGAQVRWPKAKI